MKKRWRYIKEISNKRMVGSVWFVQKGEGNELQDGFFKFTNETSYGFSGSVPINEYMAYLLGKEIGLPLATIVPARINQVEGVISLKKVKDRTLYNWAQMWKKFDQPLEHVLQSDRLIKMFVFDVWIVNIDRNNRNILFYKSEQFDDLYDFYLIDHGLSLLGAFQWKRKSWDDPYWEKVASYKNKYMKGLPEFLLQNEEKLTTYAEEIQTISDRQITKLVDSVRDLKKSEKDMVRNFLIQRKNHLPEMINRWATDYMNQQK